MNSAHNQINTHPKEYINLSSSVLAFAFLRALPELYQSARAGLWMLKPMDPKAVQEAIMAEWDRRGNKDPVKVKGEVLVANNNKPAFKSNNPGRKDWKP
jgi:hypothetical protein